MTFRSLCQSLALGCLTIAAFSVGISTTATSISFVLAFLFSLLCGRWLSQFKYLGTNPALFSFWLLFALYVIGVSYTVSTPHDTWRDLQKMHWLLMTPFFASVIDHDRWRRRLLNAFLLSMALTLVLSFAKAAGLPMPYPLSKVSANNVFFEHIVQTFFLTTAGFIAALRAVSETQHRALYALFAILVAINVFFFSESATGIISFTVFLVYLLAWRFSIKQFFIGTSVALALIIVALATSHPVQQRLVMAKHNYQQYQQGQTITSLGLRLAMWENATALLQKAPWYGYGTGGIKHAMQDKLTEAQIARTGLLDYVEISPLNFLLQFGIPGIVILITLIWFQFRTTFFLPEPYRPLMQAFLLAYLAGSVINCFFISFCETHWYALMAAVCFSTLPTAVLEKRRDLAYA